MSTGKVLLGIAAGLAAGVLVGILFAPDKGSETRKKIAQQGKDYADDLTEKMNSLIGEVTDKFESLLKKTTAEKEAENV